jgi:hypothetical protein
MSTNETSKVNDTTKTSNNEISIKELVEVIWKRKIFIGIVMVSVFLVTIIGALIYDNATTNMVVYVNVQWDGIEIGEYPDGTTFDYTQAISPEVITNAIDEAGFDLSSSDVREATDVEPVIPSDTLTLIQNSLNDGEQMNYFATNYKITMNFKKLGISENEADDFLITLVNKFEEDFEKNYVFSEQVIDFTGQDIASYDYIDSYVILENQLKVINELMIEKNIENPEFNSITVNQGFSEILVRTSLINQVKIQEIKSRVNTYLLSKDPDYLVTKYYYLIEENTLALNKALAKETDLQVLIDNYSGSVTTILIPGVDSGTVLEIDTYYEVLLENMIGVQSTIAELQEDINYYELLIDRIEGNSSEFVITEQKRSEEIATVEDLIDESVLELSVIIADANDLLTDYQDYKISTIINPLTTPQAVSEVSVMLYGAVALIVGLGIGTVVVLFKHDWK